MARTSDPDSATAQFFINVNDNSSLDYPSPDGHGYAVFGKVKSGMHVVNRIKMVKTGQIAGHSDVPMDTVVIKSIRRK
jgi:peptidyl-prolyl cis-trans isomerase A (cyclophilin A)